MSVKNINTTQLSELINSGNVEIIDVREPDEYEIIRIKDAKLVPMGSLMARLDEVDWEKTVVFYCRTGGRSGVMVEEATKTGKEVLNLSGGIEACFRDKDFQELEITGSNNDVEKYLP